MADEKNLCLSGTGVTKVFGFGRTRTVAVDHVDFAFHEREVISIVGEWAAERLPWRRCSWD